MSYAYCCEVCADTNPRWRIERSGDAVVSWADDDHLAAVVSGLQRDGEVTELTVRDSRKLRDGLRDELSGLLRPGSRA